MLPKVLHTYQHHHFDSLRWEHFVPRPGDIVVSTSYKAGTTWTQEILRQLIFHDDQSAAAHSTPLSKLSPWLDFRATPLEEVLGNLEAQSHRRFIKTHLALDGLIFFPQLKYIVVARDARDVFMSFWNHYSNYTAAAYERFNQTPGLVGPPLPVATEIHEVWHNWITRGWFEWESEGYPFWGNMHHAQSWWNYRHLNNILFVHYSDLLTHLPEELRRIADFLEIAIDDDEIASILPNLSLEAMRNNDKRLDPNGKQTWQEGAQTFFFKGTNGRWKDVLSSDELALYEQTAARVLTPDCRNWLEQGRVSFTNGRQDTL